MKILRQYRWEKMVLPHELVNDGQHELLRRKKSYKLMLNKGKHCF